MKKTICLLLCLSWFGTSVQAQTGSPYRTSVAVDAPIIIVGMGASGYGLKRLYDKKRPTQDEVARLDKNDINKFDRFSAGNYSLNAKKASDFPFYSSFALPLLLLLDDDINQNAGQMGILYLETMAITGALFAMTTGHIDRYRPLVYSPIDNDEKYKRHAKNSFYAGHTAAAAAATFFVAKVYHDYNPDNGGRFILWGAAAAIPASVGYLRHRAGKHFLSDNLLGYALGTTVGILVPQLHKTSNRTGISIAPVMFGPEKGVLLSYNIK